jgi:hypothetical protein
MKLKLATRNTLFLLRPGARSALGRVHVANVLDRSYFSTTTSPPELTLGNGDHYDQREAGEL